MENAAENTQAEHQRRIGEQIAQYATTENMHAQLPDMFSYWQTKYFAPRYQALTGTKNFLELYVSVFTDRIRRTGNKRVASLGSGDGAIEVQIAARMRAEGVEDFEFHLIELSPVQNERAKAKAAEQGLEAHFIPVECDFNTWRADQPFAAVMAHHALHHVVDLEHLFQAIHDGLEEEGAFVTFDVIGRNGHMRWPEAYKLINLMWHFLPPEKRKHHLLNRLDDDFFNHDCSTQGFEGIRSQDILPLLVKTFHFEVFYAFGNLIDVFTSRGYGQNFSTKDPLDLAFIDFVEELNELLLEQGYLKPTRLCAVMGKHAVAQPRLYRGWTPEQMLRQPD